MRERLVRVELMGGVGNQLFQYFAGKSLATLTNARLELDVSLIGINGTTHKSGLEHFDLDLKFRDSRVKRCLNKTIFGRVNRKLYRTSDLYRQLVSLIRNHYQSPILGYDQKLLTREPPITISGYFQSRDYFFDCASRENIDLNLRTPTEWFLSMVPHTEQDKILAIHVRRGDYLQLKDSFGLLSHDYYVDALERANQNFKFDKIWVFSDDLRIARQLLHGIENLYFIEPPVVSNPVESLVLMSKCRSFIISNSTFAWWASLLSKSASVIYPSPWFKTADYSKDLDNPDWISIPSDWED